MRVWITGMLLLLHGLIGAQAQGEAVVHESDNGQAEALSADKVTVNEKIVGVELLDRTFFTDRLATGIIYFDTVVEQPEEWKQESDTCLILELETRPSVNEERGESVAIVRFLPKSSGIVTLPSIRFHSETQHYISEPVQFVVSALIQSPVMLLSIEPAKHKVYVDEPVRFDLVWECDLPARGLRALQLNPSFFQNPDVEVVIPRNTEDEKQQVGLPIGGRRVIATRQKPSPNSEILGQIRLPIYLRFSQAGTFSIPETKLEVALIEKPNGDFGRYAAHFNNGFFETVDGSEVYDRIYTTAGPIEIEVLPLPSEKPDSFSGLFEPLAVEVSVRPDEVLVGELMELELRLNSNAPHGMLDLPPLQEVAGLREKFLIDSNYARIWQEKGSTYKVRLRALTTSLKALPSFSIAVFDPDEGQFTTIRTEAIPLKVSANDGQEFIALSSFRGAGVTLSEQPEGIWHNLEANPMNEPLNFLYSIVQDTFWILILLGPLAFFCLLPFIKGSRLRATDSRYRSRTEALRELKRLPAHSEAKWAAFLRFMACTFNAGDRAWTEGDSKRALREIGASDEEIAEILAMHRAADAHEFSRKPGKMEFQGLDRLSKRVARLAARASLCFFFIVLLQPESVQASEWSEAEQQFARAQAAPQGSAAADVFFTDAALKFEAAARSGEQAGRAWYNAGNAWFQTSAIGRAIAAYSEAIEIRPFDSTIRANLNAARALVRNEFPLEKTWWQQVPLSWLKVFLVISNLCLWCVLMIAFRYRGRFWLITSAAFGSSVALLALLTMVLWIKDEVRGAVIVDAVYAKKGPSYAYANAFKEPLHDGLEFTLIEKRDDWVLVELADGRRCWLPLAQTQLVGMRPPAN